MCPNFHPRKLFVSQAVWSFWKNNPWMALICHQNLCCLFQFQNPIYFEGKTKQKLFYAMFFFLFPICQTNLKVSKFFSCKFFSGIFDIFKFHERKKTFIALYSFLTLSNYIKNSHKIASRYLFTNMQICHIFRG